MQTIKINIPVFIEIEIADSSDRVSYAEHFLEELMPHLDYAVHQEVARAITNIHRGAELVSWSASAQRQIEEPGSGDTA